MVDRTNTNLNYTGLIQKYIGTAYDRMAYLADHIPSLEELLKLIEDGDLDELLKYAHLIPILIDDIAEFLKLYLGSYPDDPLTDRAGDPIIEGALYFNTTYKLLYVYYNQAWIPVGAVQNNVENIIITADMINGIDVIVPLSYPYIMGTHALTVFINNIYVYDNMVDPVNGSYTEQTIEALHFETLCLEEGDMVTVISNTEITNISLSVEMIQKVYNTKVSNESIVTIPDNIVYQIGTHGLEVYVNRRLQLVNLDYLEISTTAVQFLTPLSSIGTEVVFNVGILLTNRPSHVVIQDFKPDETQYAIGTLWFNSSNGRTYILYKDVNSIQWVLLSEERGALTAVPPPPAYILDSVFQCDTPDVNIYGQGSRWFNTCTGEEFILYADINSRQWLKIYK